LIAEHGSRVESSWCHGRLQCDHLDRGRCYTHTIIDIARDGNTSSAHALPPPTHGYRATRLHVMTTGDALMELVKLTT
jgi:hypothetical protein